MKYRQATIDHALGLVFVLLLTAGFAPSAVAQVCSVSPITLSSQADVDGFQGTYGPCDTLTQNLTVSGGDITDLSGLSGITTAVINVTIAISGNAALTQLDGLSGLTNVHWLDINNNAALANIDGLSNIVSASGPVIINGNASLTHVNGLSGLSALPGGALFIENNPSLNDISGVSGITSINASLVIGNNDLLVNLDALAGLTHVNSNIVISDNAALTSISGLSTMFDTFSETLYLQNNPSLASLQGLEGVSSIGGLNIFNNAALTDLDPLSNLSSVGNGGLAVWHNSMLTSIDGLAGVEGVEWYFILSNNPSLSLCSVLETLLDEVDDFDPGPGPGPEGIPDIGGDVTVEVNAEGCNSIEEITGAAPPPEPPVEPPPPPPPPPPPTPTAGPVVPVPTLGWNALALLALLTLGVGIAGLRRLS